MSGAVKTVDKYADKYAPDSHAIPFTKTKPLPGTDEWNKEQYAKHRGWDPDDVKDEGLLGAKEKYETEKQDAIIASDKESARLAGEAADAAALDKKQQSQKDALKRRGRRASILTGTDSELGSVSRPKATAAETLG